MVAKFKLILKVWLLFAGDACNINNSASCSSVIIYAKVHKYGILHLHMSLTMYLFCQQQIIGRIIGICKFGLMLFCLCRDQKSFVLDRSTHL